MPRCAESASGGGHQDETNGRHGAPLVLIREVGEGGHAAHAVAGQCDGAGDAECGEHLAEVVGELLDAVGAQ
ncbi:hypothetical protein BN970_06818 [Mycolicibacterium conceptionense]|uniref:Uncharacterized protein n=1 Tax=Mycolicibacterium conceptionense TaxID=451644 RepID=A0A0U1E1G0_9MYCO|nr:hypothetical protein BN970_06818 [Mycolicibacterium conceptionense]